MNSPTEGSFPSAAPHASANGTVLHVVGVVTDEVFSFLGPATQALALQGFRQSIVMVDDERFQHHVDQLSGAAELFKVPAQANPWRQWRAVQRQFREMLVREPLRAVHLHGILPAFVSALALRRVGFQAPVFFSPHASRSLGLNRWFAAGALQVFRRMIGASRISAIINLSDAVPAFDGWQSTELVDSPVGDVFFEAASSKAVEPLIVVGGRNQGARNVELFAQLAVLLGGTDLKMKFLWVGAVEPALRQRLAAAQVVTEDATSDLERASRLASAWLVVAPGATRGFPLFLLEAMASGLPCVVLDCPQHRALLRDGVSGFLCATESDMLSRIAQLVDSPTLRQTMGAEARRVARLRFNSARFGKKLLAAYELHDSP